MRRNIKNLRLIRIIANEHDRDKSGGHPHTVLPTSYKELLIATNVRAMTVGD